jgi:hypothetical protein
MFGFSPIAGTSLAGIGAGGAGPTPPDPDPSGAVDHRRRRQYIVRRKDELFIFDNPFDAQAFEDQGKPPLVTPIGKGPRRAPKLVKASETVSLPAVVDAAPDWAKQQLEKMIAKAQYARLLDMVAELEEEDELEMILLNL